MDLLTNAKEIGHVIRLERKRQGLTQTKLAHYAGVGINFISQLENGKSTVELDKTLRVLNALGFDIIATKRGGE